MEARLRLSDLPNTASIGHSTTNNTTNSTQCTGKALKQIMLECLGTNLGRMCSGFQNHFGPIFVMLQCGKEVLAAIWNLKHATLYMHLY